jgi:phospholipid/cholesterol/gamma-HCH transport system ATP-binding protein
MNNETIIQIKHLKKVFAEGEVLSDINLELKKGHNVVVMGRSGTGKSVLLKCIVKLIEPDQGTLDVFGTNMFTIEDHQLEEFRKKIGYVFQGGALYDSLSVRQNLEFPLRRTKNIREQGELNDLVDEALENVGLTESIDKMPSELSGGMKKRVGLARTLIMKPEIILYDEPTTGLDPITSREISELMLSIREKYDTTSLTVTHDVKCARLTGDWIKLLKDGRFYAEGKFDELKEYTETEVKEYFV